MSRNISKRIELNDLEAKTLKMKADQCHLSESDYLRELIMNSQPVEAPPRQFYVQMEKVNRIAAQIQQILVLAGDSVQAEQLETLRSLYEQLIRHIVGIKEIVSKARYFSKDAYENWEHEVEEAKKEGRIPSRYDEYLEKKDVIMHPATDYDLGWNALGIRPPFLSLEKEAEHSVPETGVMERSGAAFSGSDDGSWRTEPPISVEQENISAADYAASRILIPPKKEGDT